MEGSSPKPREINVTTQSTFFFRKFQFTALRARRHLCDINIKIEASSVVDIRFCALYELTTRESFSLESRFNAGRPSNDHDDIGISGHHS